MGRLEDIVERNKHPRRNREGRVPWGLLVSAFVLLILVLMIFTDPPKPASKPADQAPPPEEKGRVHDIGIYVEHSHRDAATHD